MSIAVNCPHCQRPFDLREAREDAAWREFVAVLVTFPATVQPALLRYLELFRPAKQSQLRSSTLLTLAKELHGPVTTQSMRRNHNTYTVPHGRWAGAMEHLCNTQDKLTLPLKSNGYLLEVIAGILDKEAAKAEQGLRNSAAVPAPRAVPPATPHPPAPRPAPVVDPVRQRENNARQARDILAALGAGLNARGASDAAEGAKG